MTIPDTDLTPVMTLQSYSKVGYDTLLSYYQEVIYYLCMWKYYEDYYWLPKCKLGTRVHLNGTILYLMTRSLNYAVSTSILPDLPCVNSSD